MKILSSAGRSDIAMVYVAEMDDGRLVEFVESVQPPIPREQKWVLIISTLYGCPVGCRMCDAGEDYQGKLSARQMLAQIDYMVRQRYPDGRVPVAKLKIQFARMGEPAFNDAVLEVLRELPRRYDVPGLLPCVSTVAPAGRENFMERLREVKNELYGGGRFQLQFSIHATDERYRDRLMPVRKWSLEEIADYGVRFRREGDRKVTLSFALSQDAPLEAEVMKAVFDPEHFLIKVTPVNPTYRSYEHALASAIVPEVDFSHDPRLIALREAGYEALVSIGEWEENKIGSNCGQYIQRIRHGQKKLDEIYTYGDKKGD